MSANQPIRILIADDHDLVREGITARLSISEEMEICGEAANGNETLQLAATCNADIIFLDISMPDMTGLEVAKLLLQEDPSRKIIFLSIYDNPEYVHEALRIGAKGYLLKDISREEMILAVKAIHNGGTYLGSKVSQLFGKAPLIDGAKPCKYKLSDREREILLEIARGESNKSIAEKLNISVRTVESHRLAIREKTGGGNAADLARIADEIGIV